MLNAKGFALTCLVLAITGSACSKQDDATPVSSGTPTVETFPISTGAFKNCRFQDQSPVYTLGSTIPLNPIVCDFGVATSVQLLSPTPLPNGIQFEMNHLWLAGVATQRLSQTPYEFYIENASGYQILKLKITVQ